MVANPVDDGAEHFRQFRGDNQKSFLIGLRRDDLQQRHEFTGGGQPVLHETVVRQLEQLFDAYSRGT